jgi:acetylornithine deacetylase/succinyl-diaminopimelate desuccinylase-like protein
LAEILRRNAPQLAADAWLFCDGPVHQSRRQQIVFGVRGVTGAEITVYGPSHGLHSGHYGNWAPNPVTLLANLVASMRDDDGKILIKSFYDDVAPVTAAERAAAATAPPVDSALRSEVQLAATEARDAPLVDRIMLPALNLRGIRGGGVGATASNTIPTEATASIDFRLVPRQTPERVRALVEAHVRSRGFFIVDHDPTRAERMAHARVAKITWEAGYPATRVAMDSPLARAVIRATRESLGAPIVTLPTMGGSLPLSIFENALHTPLIVLPIANHDDNQHAANENLRLQNLFDGIQVFAGVIARVGQYWR